MIRATEEGIILRLKVQPGARKNGIVGRWQDMLKLKVTASPEGGKANRACIGLLSQALDVPKSSIKIVKGHTGREKQVSIFGLEKQELLNRLKKFLAILLVGCSFFNSRLMGQPLSQKKEGFKKISKLIWEAAGLQSAGRHIHAYTGFHKARTSLERFRKEYGLQADPLIIKRMDYIDKQLDVLGSMDKEELMEELRERGEEETPSEEYDRMQRLEEQRRGQEDMQRRQEEWRRQEEQRRRQEQWRRQEEQRRQQEQWRRQQEQQRRQEQWRRQEEQRRQQEQWRRDQERRRQEEQLRRMRQL